ncbi:hypothetical protein RND81_09G037600 [Saponaria officinalis]|uniref:NAC domain-containing protein n=1 Tax=Saponaria officinalis TaxID=3572 RepID=A0AAW1IIH2_SAPOF
MGVRFKPTKTQLVGYFLDLKLSRQPWPTCYPQFLDFDVYNDHPFNVLSNTMYFRGDGNGAYGGMDEGYFFSRLKKTTSDGKRITRFINGHGTWSEKSKTKKVYDETMSFAIGTDKYFKFKPIVVRANNNNNNSNNNMGGHSEEEWMMHEYSHLGYETDIVLCHIIKKQGTQEDEFGDVCRSFKRSHTYAMGNCHEAGPSNKRGCTANNYNGMMPQGFADHGLVVNTSNNAFETDVIGMMGFNNNNNNNNINIVNPIEGVENVMPKVVIGADDGLEGDTSVEALTEEIENLISADDDKEEDNDVSDKALTEVIEGLIFDDKEEDIDISDEALAEEIEGLIFNGDKEEDETCNEQDKTMCANKPEVRQEDNRVIQQEKAECVASEGARDNKTVPNKEYYADFIKNFMFEGHDNVDFTWLNDLVNF